MTKTTTYDHAEKKKFPNVNIKKINWDKDKNLGFWHYIAFNNVVGEKKKKYRTKP